MSFIIRRFFRNLKFRVGLGKWEWEKTSWKFQNNWIGLPNPTSLIHLPLQLFGIQRSKAIKFKIKKKLKSNNLKKPECELIFKEKWTYTCTILLLLNSLEKASNSFVTSSLDECNSLFSGFLASTLALVHAARLLHCCGTFNFQTLWSPPASY